MKTIADYKQAYAIAKASGDTAGMKAANDGANSIRAQTGGLAQYATQDIANTQAQVDAVKASQTPAASSVSGIYATAGGTPVYEATVLPTTSNYTDYIQDLYAAQQDAAIADLESAYKSNMAELDASEAEIAPVYQASRNQTAAASEQSKRNFAAYASANGLNAGTSGQAELTRGVTLQNKLSSLNEAEADAYSARGLQRTQLANAYHSAIASAKADGNEQLASSLYQEAVRVEQSLAATAASQAALEQQAYQSNLSARQTEAANAQSLSDTQYSRKLEIARIMAQYGDFSGYEALGINTAAMSAAWNRAQA